MAQEIKFYLRSFRAGAYSVGILAFLFLWEINAIALITPPSAQTRACEIFRKRLQAFVDGSTSNQNFIYYQGSFLNANKLLEPNSLEMNRLQSDPDFQIQIPWEIQRSDLINNPLGIGPFALFHESTFDKACVYFGEPSTLSKGSDSVTQILPMFRSTRKIAVRIHLKNLFFPNRLAKEKILVTGNTLDVEQPLEISNSQDTANSYVRDISNFLPATQLDSADRFEVSFSSLRLKPKHSIETELNDYSFNPSTQKIQATASIRDLNSKQTNSSEALDHLTFSNVGLAFCYEQISLWQPGWTKVCNKEVTEIKSMSVPIGGKKVFELTAPVNLSPYFPAKNFRVVLYSSTEGLSVCDVENLAGPDSCIYAEKKVSLPSK